MRLPTMCRAYFDGLTTYLYSEGVSRQQLHSHLGWAPSEFVGDSARVPLRVIENILDAGSTLLDDENFPSQAGAIVGRNAVTLIDYLLMSASGLGDVVSDVREFSPLLIDQGVVEINGDLEKMADGALDLVWQMSVGPRPSSAVQQFYLASWFSILRKYFNRGAEAPAEINIGKSVSQIQFTNSVVLCSCDKKASITIPARSLQQSLWWVKNTDMHVMMVELAKQELRALSLENRVVASVYRMIAENLGEERASLVSIAIELGVSPRTLQRRLGDADTSFKELLDSVRMNICREQIREENVSLEDISGALGFASQAAFYRAFKRWFGDSPSRYRSLADMGRKVQGAEDRSMPSFNILSYSSIHKINQKYPLGE